MRIQRRQPQDLGRGVGSDTFQKLSMQNLAQQSGEMWRGYEWTCDTSLQAWAAVARELGAQRAGALVAEGSA